MFTEIFEKHKPILGVIQLLPLPGSSGWNGRLEEVIVQAQQEATALASGGVDGILLENYYDSPHNRHRIDVAGAVAMATVAREIRALVELPIGISVLENDPETALSIALSVDAAFIRVQVLVGTLISESGLIEGKLTPLVATLQRLKIDPQPKILVDITKNNIVPAAQREAPWVSPLAYISQVVTSVTKHGVADGLIVSEQELSPENVAQLGDMTDLPIMVGKELLPDQAAEYYGAGSGIILGAGFKKTPINGMDFRTTIDVTRVEKAVSGLQVTS
ncbi:MAG: BtpA/SgcQ family protein [Vampirovibrio sp.]|nr:BtpA/SgcQ family protein [Vampirovibrio sp.]